MILCAFSKNSFTRSYFQENLEMKTIWIIFVGNKQHYSHTLCIFHIFSTAFNSIVVLILLAQENLRGMKPCGCAEMSRTLYCKTNYYFQLFGPLLDLQYLSYSFHSTYVIYLDILSCPMNIFIIQDMYQL